MEASLPLHENIHSHLDSSPRRYLKYVFYVHVISSSLRNQSDERDKEPARPTANLNIFELRLVLDSLLVELDKRTVHCIHGTRFLSIETTLLNKRLGGEAKHLLSLTPIPQRCKMKENHSVEKHSGPHVFSNDPKTPPNPDL